MGNKIFSKVLLVFFVLIIGSTGNASNYISDGYMDKISYSPGDTGRIFINARSITTNAKLYLHNVNNIVVDSVITNLSPQNINAANIAAPWQKGFGYLVSFKYIIKNNLPSGIYNWEGKIFFIIKNANKNADITIIYPSNTEAAYNNAGGKSFYIKSSTHNKPGDTLSFLRPLTAVGLSVDRMYSDPIMKWLNTITGYSIQVICDQDLDDYTEIQNSKIVCVVGHSEYWTRAARTNFDQFVNSGKDAIVLSGNTMWWQVRYDSTDKTRIICYKSLADPISNPLLKTIQWTDPSLNYSILSSIGVDWLHGAFPASTKPGAYLGWGGYKIMIPNSPILAGTGLNFKDTLSCKTREYDGTLINGVNEQGDPILDTTTLGFCKIELIGYDTGEEGLQSTNVKGYGTFIAFKKTPTSGNIINVGSTQWCADNFAIGYPGGFGGKDSRKIKQIVLNMFDLLLTKSNIYSAPNPGCLGQPLDLDILSNIQEIIIYPNPAGGQFRIEANTMDKLNVDLYDINGRHVYSASVNDKSQIDVTNLIEGVYAMTIKTVDHVTYKSLCL